MTRCMRRITLARKNGRNMVWAICCSRLVASHKRALAQSNHSDGNGKSIDMVAYQCDRANDSLVEQHSK